ncbi:MAG: T9SS type A sorting domain-containing protein [Bacteroidota bacterium]
MNKFIILIIFSILVISIHGQTTHIIEAGNYSFSPASLSGVEIGDTIKWKWEFGSHTTTSIDIPEEAESWDSPLTPSNIEFAYVPMVAGSYNYICVPHEARGMEGSFTVQTATPVASTSNESTIVSPNPFKEVLTIKPAPGKTVEHVIVTDMLGKELLIGPETYWNAEKIILHFANARAGIYFVNVIFVGGENEIIRVVSK